MSYKTAYEKWMSYPELLPALKEELVAITDEAEIEDRFYQNLEFGTAGMRGKIGVGINRMNQYTVARASAGLGATLKATDERAAEKGVVIAYDSRNMSPEFAKTTAGVLSAMGIKVYIFDSLRPVPVLSFSVRYLKAAGGVTITASHNPKEYNGYKVYGFDGGQMVDATANALIREIETIDDMFSVDIDDFDTAVSEGRIEILDSSVDDAYIAAVKGIVRPYTGSGLKIIYTPLHGSGKIPVERVLTELGYDDLHIVKEQAMPDGNFPTVSYPNPEEKSVFNIAMKMAEEIGADIIIGTDPDCDRVGAVCKNSQGEYVVFTGNQTGALLVDYYLKTRTDLLKNTIVVKTIVTSELGGVVARANGAEVIDVLTGFKYIGEQMNRFENSDEKTFAFGYEESYGYLAGNYARDKDAVFASSLICEMADYYKNKGMTLYDALIGLYEEHGYFVEGIEAMTLEGSEGKKKIAAIMEAFRGNYFKEFSDAKLVIFNDYLLSASIDVPTGTKSIIDLPKSNVLKFIFNENSWYALRPSGTEPKLKIYYSVTGKTAEAAQQKLDLLKETVGAIVAAVK